MSSTPDSDTGEQMTLDDATGRAQQRRAALQGGARYRQTSRDRSESSPSISQECQSCGGHVSKQFVRVFGVDGQVHGCHDCLEHPETDLVNGAAAGRERRDTL